MKSNTKTWTQERWSDFESFVEGVIYDRDLSVSARLFGLFLFPFSILFKFIVKVRVFLYSKSLVLKDKPLDCLVIVVGNLTVGGTGKTPIVERFARELMQRGKRVGILSRGYKSKEDLKKSDKSIFSKSRKVAPPKVVSDGKNVLLDSEEAGDEPYMLASNLPGAIVLVAKDRVNAGRFAIKEFDVDVLILDDGFQYLSLKGQLNLLLIDQTNPFGNGKLLPRGILREPIPHLSRATYVFLTKSEVEPDLELLQSVRKFNDHAEIIRCIHRAKHLRKVNGTESRDLSFLNESYVGVFCGIASPRGFENLINRMSGELRFKKRFLDHHRYEKDELDHMFQKARNAGADVMITTEKDAVRIPGNYEPILPFYYVRMEIEIIEGFDDFKDAVDDICFAEENLFGPKAGKELADSQKSS